jgi:hypothetical protein
VLVKFQSATRGWEEATALRDLVNRAAIARDRVGDSRILIVLTGYVTPGLLGDVEKAGFEVLDACDRSYDRRIREYLDGIEVTVRGDRPAALAPSSVHDEASMRSILQRLEHLEKERIENEARREERLKLAGGGDKNLEEHLVAANPEVRESGQALSLEQIFEERPRRLKYVGTVSKATAVLAALFFIWTGIYALLFQLIVRSHSDSDSTAAVVGRLLGTALPFITKDAFTAVGMKPPNDSVVALSVILLLFALTLLYIDSVVAGRVLDRLMRMRKRDFLIRRDPYLIFKREEKALAALDRASLAFTFLHHGRLNQYIYELEKEEELRGEARIAQA